MRQRDPLFCRQKTGGRLLAVVAHVHAIRTYVPCGRNKINEEVMANACPRCRK